MTNYRECILTKLREEYLKSDTLTKEKLVTIANEVKTLGDPIKLRQLWLKVCKPFSRQLDINGGEVILEPAAVKDKTMSLEEANLLFNGNQG